MILRKYLITSVLSVIFYFFLVFHSYTFPFLSPLNFYYLSFLFSFYRVVLLAIFVLLHAAHRPLSPTNIFPFDLALKHFVYLLLRHCLSIYIYICFLLSLCCICDSACIPFSLILSLYIYFSLFPYFHICLFYVSLNLPILSSPLLLIFVVFIFFHHICVSAYSLPYSMISLDFLLFSSSFSSLFFSFSVFANLLSVHFPYFSLLSFCFFLFSVSSRGVKHWFFNITFAFSHG